MTGPGRPAVFAGARTATSESCAAKPAALYIDRHRPQEDGFQSIAELEARHGPLPVGPRQRSGGGGMYLLFRYPEHAELTAPKTLAPGVEIVPITADW